MLAALSACHGMTVGKKPAILFGACAVITRTKKNSLASSKVSAVVLTWPVMDKDDCTSYCGNLP